jgi:peptide/nickel transport system permease protein
MSIADREHMPAGAGAVVVEGLGPTDELGEVKARGYWEQVWRRFKRDRAAMVSGVFVVLLVLVAFIGAPVAAHILGHGPDDQFPRGAYVANDFTPVGPLSTVEVNQNTHATSLFILGADGTLGRDEFLRLLYGAQVSLIVAVIATGIGIGLGLLLGVMAGYYGGWADTLISRLTEIVMAFPYLLFAVALAATVGDRLNGITLGGILSPGILSVTIVLSVFSWFYPARIMRAQVLSLREKEFVEAARMTGASNARIMRSHLLPHLAGPLIVYSTLIIATNVLGEASLSYLGLGVEPPTSSWGALLEDASQFYTIQPWLMVWPGLAILLATLAFNLLGDGLRDAFDPRGSR